MTTDPAITAWIAPLKEGDQTAAQRIWDEYFERLVRLARKHLQGLPRRVADEEDVALSAFNSFCSAAARGRFPRLSERESLWRILITVTVRKAQHLRRDQTRQKRNANRLIDDRPFELPDGTEMTSPIEMHADPGPSPELVVEMAEQTQRLLGGLSDPQLRQIAIWKMEGYTNDEIAGGLNCALSTVERRLRLIRDLWSQELNP
jgi:DNA-directed RNA polymerase specialized sigma24 family protein